MGSDSDQCRPGGILNNMNDFATGTSICRVRGAAKIAAAGPTSDVPLARREAKIDWIGLAAINTAHL